MMELGATFPQTEIGNDPAVIRDFAQAAEQLGYDYLLAYDHVLGADPDRPGGWNGPYNVATTFHEPFVLFGYLAACTSRIELATGVIIVPQRQTALVAKQVAELDILSGGRIRLGIGTGWNAVEYEALNEDFHNRGARQAEQVEVMRLLWENDTVDYKGRWHRIDRAGIRPRPQRRIPIWFGGSDERMLKRMARLGDGWMVNRPPTDDTIAAVDRVRGWVKEAGRDPGAFGLQGMIGYQAGPERWPDQMQRWRDLDASHVGVVTMSAGLASPRDHIDAIRRFKEAMG
jgi:probable F420-dependent oxidoreductase